MPHAPKAEVRSTAGWIAQVRQDQQCEVCSQETIRRACTVSWVTGQPEVDFPIADDTVSRPPFFLSG